MSQLVTSMKVMLNSLKWFSFLAASGFAGFILLLTLLGKGPSQIEDWLFALLWCLLLASPGFVIYKIQKNAR